MRSKQSAQIKCCVKTLFVNRSYNNDYLFTKNKQMNKQFHATKSSNPMGLENKSPSMLNIENNNPFLAIPLIF
jgi:hypothetical protein